MDYEKIWERHSVWFRMKDSMANAFGGGTRDGSGPEFDDWEPVVVKCSSPCRVRDITDAFKKLFTARHAESVVKVFNIKGRVCIVWIEAPTAYQVCMAAVAISELGEDVSESMHAVEDVFSGDRSAWVFGYERWWDGYFVDEQGVLHPAV